MHWRQLFELQTLGGGSHMMLFFKYRREVLNSLCFDCQRIFHSFLSHCSKINGVFSPSNRRHCVDYLVFLSPSLSHFVCDCWAQYISFRLSHWHSSICETFLSDSSNSVKSLSLARDSRSCILFSRLAIPSSILPNSSVFDFLMLFLTALSFPMMVCPCDCAHDSLINFKHPRWESQQLRNRKGLGPHSCSRAASNSGQWSDMLLLRRESFISG